MENLTEVKFNPARLIEARGVLKATTVAKAIGVSPQRYYSYERGKDAMKPDIFARLCIYHKKPAEWFCEK